MSAAQDTNTMASVTRPVKRSSILLIIGGGLLAAGLVIAAFSTFTVAKEVLEGAVIINETSIEPGLAYASVLKDLPAGRQLLFSLTSDPSDIPLRVELTDPDGTALKTYNITRTPFTGAVATKTAGDHTLEIRNVGNGTVNVSGALLDSPVVEEGGGVSVEDNSSLQRLVTFAIAAIVGILLIIAGIILLIIGAIKHFKEKKVPESIPP